MSERNILHVGSVMKLLNLDSIRVTREDASVQLFIVYILGHGVTQLRSRAAHNRRYNRDIHIHIHILVFRFGHQLAHLPFCHVKDEQPQVYRHLAITATQSRLSSPLQQPVFLRESCWILELFWGICVLSATRALVRSDTDVGRES